MLRAPTPGARRRPRAAASPLRGPTVNDARTKLDVLPALAAAALLIAVAAATLAAVAIGSVRRRSADRRRGDALRRPRHERHELRGHGAYGTGVTTGITDAPGDRGGVPLEGVRRDGALKYTLDARPVWWRQQKLVAWAYSGIVPGPTIRVANGERVRIRFTNRRPEEITIHWHGIGVPSSQGGVPGVAQKAIAPGRRFTYEFTARPAGARTAAARSSTTPTSTRTARSRRGSTARSSSSRSPARRRRSTPWTDRSSSRSGPPTPPPAAR